MCVCVCVLKAVSRNFPESLVQGLRFNASTTGVPASIPGWGTKILQAA